MILKEQFLALKHLKHTYHTCMFEIAEKVAYNNYKTIDLYG